MRQYDSVKLVTELMIPASFLVINMLYLNFVHDDFMKLTALSPPEDMAAAAGIGQAGAGDTGGDHETGTAVADGAVQAENMRFSRIHFATAALYSDPETFLKRIVWKPLVDTVTFVYDTTMRAMEVHGASLILVVVVLVALAEVSAVDFALVAVAVVTFALPQRLTRGLLLLINVLAALIVVVKMIFQLRFVDASIRLRNCSDKASAADTIEYGAALDDDPSVGGIVSYSNRSLIPTSDSAWAGLAKHSNMLSYLGGYVLVIVLCSFASVVRARQRRVRLWYHLPVPPFGTIFADGNRDHADDGLLECVRFLINYGFYKFGVELTFIVVIINVAVRLDALAFVYGIAVLLMFHLRRRTLSRCWPFFCTLLGLIYPCEYLLALGPPPSACFHYPWESSGTIPAALPAWFFLPTSRFRPPAWFLVGDLFQLAFAFAQLRVFLMEQRDEVRREGGSNDEIIYRPEYTLAFNPRKDYVTRTRTVLDAIKGLVFCYGYWIALAMVYLAATRRVSIFSVLYLLACFVYLWIGNELFVRRTEHVVRGWNFFIAYNVLVIVCKTALQLPACGYLHNTEIGRAHV